MLKYRVIPCLDVKDGRVVKGTNFENLIDAGDPIKQAEYYFDEGADELCFLDINASKENRSTMFEMVEKVAKKCFIPFTVGGGVSKIEDFSTLLKCGADKVSINSSAISNPELISQASNKFGSQAVVVAIDVKKNSSANYEVFTKGGSYPTGINALDWALEAQKRGAGEILLTSMDKDGTKSGYDLEIIKSISSKINIPLIASGGVGKIEHLADGLRSGASAVLAASIFHFRTYSILEVKEYLKSQNLQTIPSIPNK
ncbi:MAG: imidazole glycerol phosphate synthase subunit HisF [Proteobacteria bacterium]|nr:imidazole glycerol phosphate synthase subunit HisF [Pseudomonadota bacterium]NCA28560.1 imidazole glycerol phosphate synthase subunit HisF [Pseudomonadota bacterium]